MLDVILDGLVDGGGHVASTLRLRPCAIDSVAFVSASLFWHWEGGK